jgi:hypothetical protein
MKKVFVPQPVMRKNSLGFLKSISIFSEYPPEDDMLNRHKMAKILKKWFFYLVKAGFRTPPLVKSRMVRGGLEFLWAVYLF